MIGEESKRTLETVLAAHKTVFAEGLRKHATVAPSAPDSARPDAVPWRLAARPVPYALLPKVEEELDR